MTPLPDWLVERAALDEVPAASRDRIARADAQELVGRIAALREDNARELAIHPAGPAVAQIEARVAAEVRRERARRRMRWTALGAAASAIAVVLVVRFADDRQATGERAAATGNDGDGTRVKGKARLLAFRQVGDDVEQLEEDALVRAGDVIQLRYNAGGRRYGVIASVDGAGTVTLHYPASEDAPPEATAVPADTTSLPHAYALDDAPRFERFFFITANEPIDVAPCLTAVRALARRGDSGGARLDLPHGLHQSSLRLLKPDTHPEAP